jgi:hypothetical protein
LGRYRPLAVYDLPPYLADYLIASGYARMEMRIAENPRPPLGIERRQPASR